MTIFPGDEFTGDDGSTFRVGRMLAYQGKEGCESPRCTRVGADWSKGDMGHCAGWHCALCDEPCGSHGHSNCPRAEDVAA